MEPINFKVVRNVFLWVVVLLLIMNLGISALEPQVGSASLYNLLLPGRLRFPFGEDPAKSYSVSVYNLPALFASHQINGQKKAADEYRVLVIGDSSVWGTLLRPEETLAGQLDKMGIQDAQGKYLRFYNLGYPTMSTAKDLLILQEAMKYEPDFIIWPVTLESLVKSNQTNSPLVTHNLDRAAALARQYNLDLGLPAPQPKNLRSQNLLTIRRDLADFVRLQVYGVMWAATGIDQYYPPVYALASRDFEVDTSFHGYQDSLQAADLSLDVLNAGVQIAGKVPVLFVNEPILISDGTNSDIRYNFYYPRWAYDQYRTLLAESAEQNSWLYVDLWDQVSSSEFTNTPVHFSPFGESQIAEVLGGALPETIRTHRVPELALTMLNPADEPVLVSQGSGPLPEVEPTEPPAQATTKPTATKTHAGSPTLAAHETSLATVVPTSGNCQAGSKWKDMPVIPAYVSEKARQIYKTGLQNGNKANVFSVIGDCQSVPQVFLGVFDHPKNYRLGDQNQYLQPVIDQFAGSYDRKGMARKGGLNVAAVLSPLRADPKLCEKGETPLQCELRRNKPSIVIVSLEEWWTKNPVDIYEGYLREVLDEIIGQGAVPVLVTKADNLEGDHAINQVIVKLACEYEIPLWNFWKAADALPTHGLWTDGFHLTVGVNEFNSPQAMKAARPVRNLTGLQALNQVWLGLNQ